MSGTCRKGPGADKPVAGASHGPGARDGGAAPGARGGAARGGREPPQLTWETVWEREAA